MEQGGVRRLCWGARGSLEMLQLQTGSPWGRILGRAWGQGRVPHSANASGTSCWKLALEQPEPDLLNLLLQRPGGELAASYNERKGEASASPAVAGG